MKANVVFFTKGALTQTVWFYDGRPNVPGITKKDSPLTRGHFAASADGLQNCHSPVPIRVRASRTKSR